MSFPHILFYQRFIHRVIHRAFSVFPHRNNGYSSCYYLPLTETEEHHTLFNTAYYYYY
jgi:hypothetical protein